MSNHVSISKNDMLTLINNRYEMIVQSQTLGSEITYAGQNGICVFDVPTSLFVGLRLLNFDAISDMVILDDKNREVVQLPFNNTAESSVNIQNYGHHCYIGAIPRGNGLIGASTRKVNEVNSGNTNIFFKTFNLFNGVENGYEAMTLRQLNNDMYWKNLVEDLRYHYQYHKDDDTACFNNYHIQQIYEEDYHIQLKNTLFNPMFAVLENFQDQVFFQPAICMYGGGVKRVLCPFSYATMLIEEALGRSVGKVDFPNMYGSESLTYEKSNPEQYADKLVGLEYRRDGSLYYVRIAAPADITPTILFYS